MQKTIVCYGDSNTHGYLPAGGRYAPEKRWTTLLAKALGDEYIVKDEGLNARTICMDDPVEGGFKSGVQFAPVCMMTHNPIDLVIVMLGTNDTKERFGLHPHMIAEAMDHLIEEIKQYAITASGRSAEILVVAPSPITDDILRSPYAACFGPASAEKSRALAEEYIWISGVSDCAFLDAADCEVSPLDAVHLTEAGHARLAEKLAEMIKKMRL